jgi:hypothetical protein
VPEHVVPFLALAIDDQARSGNNPGIQREAKVAGNASRKGARLLWDISTPCSVSAETTRRAWRSPVPTMPAAAVFAAVTAECSDGRHVCDERSAADDAAVTAHRRADGQAFRSRVERAQSQAHALFRSPPTDSVFAARAQAGSDRCSHVRSIAQRILTKALPGARTLQYRTEMRARLGGGQTRPYLWRPNWLTVSRE